ncbi:MAG: ExeA family protein [Pseudomonadales bacterium]
MYKNYFGFTDIPFSIAPDPRYLYLSDQHKDALAHLLYGVGEHGGFVLLTGEVGTGKTTICRCLLQQMPGDCEVAYIVNPRQTVIELLQSICDELGVYYFYEDQGTSYLVDLINEYLLESHSKGRNTILIIDEAQNLEAEVLEQLRLLTNLETNEKKLLQLILLGQPELNELLSRQDLRQLAQRITARYHLQPLTLDEAERYVMHRLTVAGYSGELFPKESLKIIHNASGGIPRLINVICDRCLLGVYSANGRAVDVNIAKQAISEIKGKGRDSKSLVPRWLWPVMGGVTVLAAVLAGYFLLPQGEPSPATATTPAPNQRQDEAAKAQRNALLSQLAALKGNPLTADARSEPCKALRNSALDCVKSKGTLNEFLRLREAAVVELQQEGDANEWVLLQSAGDTDFKLTRVDSLAVRETREALLASWKGSYRWLWEPPQGFRKSISLGEDDRFVQWLHDALPASPAAAPSQTYALNRFSYLLANVGSANLPALVDISLLRRLSAKKQNLEIDAAGITPTFVKILASNI